jgi:hypothetical protein
MNIYRNFLLLGKKNMKDLGKIIKILQDHEKRIKVLEGNPPKQNDQTSKKNYTGLAGGIRFLIDNKFLNIPKTANEVMSELKREGYHHSLAPISKMLSINFTKNKKILNRIKEDDIWKYVLRK